MASVKRTDIPGIGVVVLTKRTTSRSIRMRVVGNQVKVSLPRWSSFKTAERFVEQNASWITEQLHAIPKAQPLLEGAKIGKQHTLHFEIVGGSSALQTRVTATRVIIRHYASDSVTDEAVQTRAITAAKRALKKEALQLLPGRVAALAQEHNLSYASITAKELSRRWGSCDSKKNLIFNIYLMQLPWSQIDYVIAHELTHTIHMNHSPLFWQTLETLHPHARGTAKLVRHTQPALTPTQSATAFDDDMAY